MRDNFRILKADIFLLVAAFIWGAAFVAQRVGMDYLPPFYFNGIRFLLGGITLLPLVLINSKKSNQLNFFQKRDVKGVLVGGFCLGSILFVASSLQQIGMIYTTAGKAGFITGLYVVIVPIVGYFLKQDIHFGVVIGVILSVIGLYLLSINEDFTIDKGDFFVFLCSVMFSFHVIAIGYFAPKYDCIFLSCIQFFVNACLSLIVAFFWESISWQAIYGGLWPILYGGFMSAGIAFTLQVVAQKDAPPAHASIIMSLESVFAALTGWWILGEVLSLRARWGCIFMFIGAVLAQIWPYVFKRNK
ncbi:EamA-like transporter family protein [Desulfonauticus submarinus]|uniref:EamA-like transporter family protein n=1 Tax=Desulfonauticus submarinus TaxID=206665 RepID=A0A1G9ZNL3_9BACT|nr:DMT family transporter [Desulfonauticus submarinus]SDN23082.1 EamA-like transporter family protein [Desulfonauticus submarinus]